MAALIRQNYGVIMRAALFTMRMGNWRGVIAGLWGICLDIYWRQLNKSAPLILDLFCCLDSATQFLDYHYGKSAS